VGHAQIRNRGTIGGSLAHADPAAELPAVMVAADARFTLQTAAGQRSVAADDFFIGQLRTMLQPDEMLVRIEVPGAPRSTGSSVQEVAKRVGDFALGGVVAILTCGEDRLIARARIVCFGVEDRPVRQSEAEQSLLGAVPGNAAFAEAGRIVSTHVQPGDDIHASGGYRKRLAGTLTERALADAFAKITLMAVA
jgi:carbon-monoxide dehydrogenase medium subunit